MDKWDSDRIIRFAKQLAIRSWQIEDVAAGHPDAGWIWDYKLRQSQEHGRDETYSF